MIVKFNTPDNLTVVRITFGPHRQETSALPIEKCCYCGSIPHEGYLCPRIKSIEYWPMGGIKKVELLGYDEAILD